MATKATGFLTNSVKIATALERVCKNTHRHIPLLSGLAKQCAAYPQRLVDEPPLVATTAWV